MNFPFYKQPDQMDCGPTCLRGLMKSIAFIMIKLILFLFFTVILNQSIVFGQSDSSVLKNKINALQQYSDKNPAEKIHLHMDRQWYDLGDTIWFKAYVVAGSTNKLTEISKVLYVELINQKDSVTNRLTLELTSGMGTGAFVIPYTYKSGFYALRAYTNYMRNDSDFVYNRGIILGGLPSKSENQIIKRNTNLSFSKATAGDANPDVQFLPEGGSFIDGLRSKVAFKAIGKNGLPANVSGTIIDQYGNEMATFDTQQAGMGDFPLTPEHGKIYFAKKFVKTEALLH